MASLNWRKPSCSGGQGGNCVEVADDVGRVLVRDTKNRAGTVLSFPADAWLSFLAGVRNS